MRNLTLSGHVGFDSLPDQLVSKSVQNGFIFNIMCIGKWFSIYKIYSDCDLIFNKKKQGKKDNAYEFAISVCFM